MSLTFVVPSWLDLQLVRSLLGSSPMQSILLCARFSPGPMFSSKEHQVQQLRHAIFVLNRTVLTKVARGGHLTVG